MVLNCQYCAGTGKVTGKMRYGPESIVTCSHCGGKAVFTADDIFNAYAKVLDAKPDSYFGSKREYTGKQIATRMFKAIYTQTQGSNYPSDWLKHNKALAEACKPFGITKSSELRELVKAEWKEEVEEYRLRPRTPLDDEIVRRLKL